LVAKIPNHELMDEDRMTEGILMLEVQYSYEIIKELIILCRKERRPPSETELTLVKTAAANYKPVVKEKALPTYLPNRLND
jgi:hypothetical protein